MKVKVKSLSRVRPSATPWTTAFQAPPSMGFSRPEYWSGVPLPSLELELARSAQNPQNVIRAVFFFLIFKMWFILWEQIEMRNNHEHIFYNTDLLMAKCSQKLKTYIYRKTSVLDSLTFSLMTSKLSIACYLASIFFNNNKFSSVHSLSRVQLLETLWTAAHQSSLSITNSQSPPKPMFIESVMPSNHLILCHPLLLLPPIPPSIRVFSNESALRIRWPKWQ